MAKMNLKEMKKGDKPIFNKLQYLLDELPPSKRAMFMEDNEVETEVLIAAKDTGKSFPIELYKYYAMERDPSFNFITLQKFSTGAIKRQSRAANKCQIYLKRKYNLKYDYEKKDMSFWMRMMDKKSILNNQTNEYSSFEDVDGLAGSTPSNGGYYGGLHIEEPSQQSDAISGKTIGAKEWNKKIATIKDTLKRSISEYNATNPYHKPLKFKIFISMNDWDEDFIISKQAEKYLPRLKFMDWTLGGEEIPTLKYSHFIAEFEDKAGIEPIPELVTWINEADENGKTRWEWIKEFVVKNHTKRVVVNEDEFGRKINTAFTRMTKMANPLATSDESKKEEIFEAMYNALITANRTELARVFGMADDGTGDLDRRFNFKKITTVNTDDYLKDRVIYGMSIGWDHDANRGPVGTPVILSGLDKWTRHGLNEREREIVDLTLTVAPQILIEGFGKGKQGENTKYYHEIMRDETEKVFDKYLNGDFKKDISINSQAVFDDDSGSYVNKFAEWLSEKGIFAYPVPAKNGKVESPTGYGRESREEMVEPDIDIGGIVFDKSNTMLLKWFKMVPATLTKEGTKSFTKGIWSSRLKDVSDSFFYGLIPFKLHIINGVLKKEG